MRKFGKDRSKTWPVELFYLKFPGCGYNSAD